MLLNIIKAALYGVVEGVTEWLPVSSTGHLILLNSFLKFNGLSPNFFKMFEVVIQFGAILAVILLYFKDLWPFKFSESKHGKKHIALDNNIMTLWFKIIVACIPVILVAIFKLDDYFDAHFYNAPVIATALIVVGLAFIIIENMHKKETRITSTDQITYKDAIIIGLFQLLAAVFPGTSRSGATIIGALLIGVARPVAANFTFYLAVPVMFGASLLKLIKFGLKFSSVELISLLVGCIVAFVVSLVIIRFFMNYIKKHNFKVFGWYRIILGIIVLLAVFTHVIA